MENFRVKRHVGLYAKVEDGKLQKIESVWVKDGERPLRGAIELVCYCEVLGGSQDGAFFGLKHTNRINSLNYTNLAKNDVDEVDRNIVNFIDRSEHYFFQILRKERVTHRRG